MPSYASCLDGYLTKACARCEYWEDGSDPNGSIGCGCPFPIMQCGAFAEMSEAKEKDMKAFDAFFPTSIRLSKLRKLLKKFNKEKGHEDDHIMVYLSGVIYEHINNEDEILVVIDDIASIIKSKIGRVIIIDTSMADTNVPESTTDGETVTVEEFLHLFSKSFDSEDHYHPHINIRRINENDACETVRMLGNMLDIKNTRRIIRRMSMEIGEDKNKYSCRILLKTY